jgi:hypothetical protein
VTVGAVAVLVLNDHVFKAVVPGWWTGKLSDLAGLVVVPALLALLMPARSAFVVTAAGFVAVKVTAVGAEVATQAWTAVAGPSLVLADPSDLVALPALGLSWWVWRRTARSPLPARRRLLVAAPLALLAVVGSAATDAPQATNARTYGGEIVVSVDGAAFATADGVSWRELTGEERAGVDSAQETSACLPDAPRHCYRIVEGRLAVDETVDGGRLWRRAWGVSEGRQAFLRRGLAPRGNSVPGPASVAVAVLGGEAAHIVVVANGLDGIAVRDGSGAWRRVGFPPGSAGGRTPAALRDFGANLWAEFALAALVALLAGWIVAHAWQPVESIELVLQVMAGGAAVLMLMLSNFWPVGFGWVFWAAVVLGTGPPWLAMVLRRPVRPVRLVLLVAAAAGGTAALTIAPFFGWSVAIPDSYRVAAALGLAGAAVGLGATILAARRLRRWTSPAQPGHEYRAQRDGRSERRVDREPAAPTWSHEVDQHGTA